MKQLFYFYADWCEPCSTLSPIMNQISKRIHVEKINIDYEANRAHEAKVLSIPTVVLAANGSEIKRFTGVKTYDQILSWLNS